MITLAKPGKRAWRSRWRESWPLGASLALLTLFLLPLRFAALRGDDTWTSEYRGEVGLGHQNMIEQIWQAARTFFESGRPNFMGTTQGFLSAWFVGDHPVLYRLTLILLTVAAAALLYALARQLGSSRAGALLVTVLLAGALQVRSYHDALAGYWGTTQLILILTLASLIFLHRSLQRDNRRLRWISLVLFFPCPMLYEGAYTLVVLHLAVALMERRGRRAFKACAPFLATGAAWVLLSIYARSTATGIVPGYEIGGSVWAAVRTYVIQLFTPIPASNIFFRADYGSFFPVGAQPTTAEILAGAWRGLAVLVLTLILSFRMAWPDGSRLPAPRALRNLAVVGGLLWTASVVAVAFAPKYQLELVAGKGHLPALTQAFGWPLVATAALLSLLRSAAGRSRAAVAAVAVVGACVLGLAAGVTGFNNIRVIALEAPAAETRGLLENAAGSGVFDALPERSTVIFAVQDMLWFTGNWTQVPEAFEGMLYDRTGQRLDARIVAPDSRLDCPRNGAFPPPDCSPPSASAAWVRVRAYPDGGSVIVARLVRPGTNPQDGITRRVRVYASGGGADAPSLTAATATNQPWVSTGLRWRKVRETDEGTIFEAAVPRLRATSLDDAKGRIDFTNLGPPEAVVRIFGTKRLLP